MNQKNQKKNPDEPRSTSAYPIQNNIPSHKIVKEYAPKSKFNDIWASILYGVFFISVFIISLLTFDNSGTAGNSGKYFDFGGSHIGILIGSMILNFLFAYLYLILLQKFPKKFIKSCLIIVATLFIVPILALGIFLGRYTVMAIVLAVYLLIGGLIFYIIRKKIPFSALLLERSSMTVQKYPATILTCFTGCIFITIYFCLVSYLASGALNSTGGKGVLFLLTIQFWWTNQIVLNTVHVIISGLFSTHYFQNGSPNGIVRNPTLLSAKRTFKYSFGSICYGSLVVIIAKYILSLFASKDKSNPMAVLLSLVCFFIRKALERLLGFLNTYAFVQVAIYGKSFCDGARDTWKLLIDRGLTVIVNDEIISFALTLGSSIGTILITGISGGIIFAVEGQMGNPEIMVLIIVAVVSTLVFYFISVPVQSGTQALLVCIAEDPTILYQNDRVFWDEIHKRYPKAAIQGVNA